jgi:hypothetical protein
MARLVRLAVGIAGALGGLFVAGAAGNAESPLAALKAIGLGVGLLVFVMTIFLADLVHVAVGVLESVEEVDAKVTEVRDEIQHLHHALGGQIEASADEGDGEQQEGAG